MGKLLTKIERKRLHFENSINSLLLTNEVSFMNHNFLDYTHSSSIYVPIPKQFFTILNLEIHPISILKFDR